MAEIPFEPYTGQSKLRFWCQKVLPLVYDDSLSYYELLGKVVEYLNNTITDVSACEDNITALRDAFVRLQDYVNEQLEDFAPEVERIINEMIDSGEFGEILADVVNGLIANEYSTTQGYAQFDYVLKDGKLYCATVSTSGEWDATKWRETTVGTDMQLLSQRLYNLNAGQVAYNEAETYDNNTVGKKLKDLDDFDDNLNAGQVAFDESATYENGTVGKKLKDLDDFDDNLNAGQVAFNESATYDNGTVGKKLKDLDDFDDNLNAGQVAFNENTTYDNGTVGKKLKDLDDFDDNLNAGQIEYNSENTYNNATVGKELQELKGSLNAVEANVAKILPIITGNTNNSGYIINYGEYFIANDTIYKATNTIPINEAWSTSATALTETPINNAIKPVAIPRRDLTNDYFDLTQTYNYFYIYQVGNMYIGKFRLAPSIEIPAHTTDFNVAVFSYPRAPISGSTYINVVSSAGSGYGTIQINVASNGIIAISNPTNLGAGGFYNGTFVII